MAKFLILQNAEHLHHFKRLDWGVDSIIINAYNSALHKYVGKIAKVCFSIILEVVRNHVPISSQDSLNEFCMKLKSAIPITFLKIQTF